jgi:diaminopimelate epimerase
MKLKFTKMHGAGNDFIVIDAINQQVDLSPEQWAAWPTAASASAPTRS